MPVHQAAKLSTNPKNSHNNAVKQIGECINGTNDKGFVLKPNLNKGLEICVEADFAGACDMLPKIHQQFTQKQDL